MKDLTTSVYSFRDLIQGNFLYVDKTEYVWRLIRPAKGLYFLSRPRRFGKSLLVSTLEAVFEGRRELFRGLALDDKHYGWDVHPVIHLDMGGRDFGTVEKMEERFRLMLREQAERHGVPLTEDAPDTMFHELIKTLHDRKGDVVILLDEYDKPILGNITKESCPDFLASLKVLYSVIKEKAEMLRFVLVTGVSKFSHVSLFSELNNLTDLTLDPDFAGMLGFTEEEVRSCFAGRLAKAARAHGTTEEGLMRLLLEWYDGYRFSKADLHVCNPVSITSFFSRQYEFDNYWGTTGVTTALFELAKTTRFNFEQALTSPVSSLAFGAYEVENIDPLGLLWQTGYLTIRKVLPGLMGASMFLLGFPNHEVEEAFNTQLLAYYSGYKDAAMSSLVFRLTDAMRRDDLEQFMAMLQSYFASIPYDIRGGDEHYYQTIFFITFLLLGSVVEAESRTNQGRIDAYVRTARTVFVFEFKLDRSAEEAVGQILDRRYYEKFRHAGLPVRLVGVNFDSDRGRIDGWQEGTPPADA